MKRGAFSLAVAVLAVLAPSCADGSAEGNGVVSDPFSRVVVTAGSGKVQIERTTGTPEWQAEVGYSGDEPSFAPTVTDGALIVDDGCTGRTKCSVDYLIAVPEGTEVVVTTTSGDVTIASISAPVTVTTTSGVVYLNVVKGDIGVTTTSGDIIGAKLEAANAEFSSTSGSVDVAFERIITNLVVTTTSGDITAQLAGSSYNLEYEAGGAVDLKIDDDDTSPYTVTLSTDSGDLTVYRQ